MSPEDTLKYMKDREVEFVDLRFTDPRGKWQHLTLDKSFIDEDFFNDGAMFDGSSIAGWKAINESDMCLKPDLATAVLDPFMAQTTLVFFCDVVDPISGEPYNRDPRSTARRAETYLTQSGIGDQAFFGPEAEFFVFDDVRWQNDQNVAGYELDSVEGPYNTGEMLDGGNMGHRPRAKGGYFPVPPVDSAQDLRSEMLTTIREMGLEPEKHHHEVAPSQHELGVRFKPLVLMADGMQIYKYVVHQVAAAYGKSATFMPKPVYGDNGSGMHVHQSIWKDSKPLFAGDKYAGLSQECLWYIGGILKHARAINAFTNATTNSYKRLVPGFEAPVLLAYSSRNRSASIRVPHVTSPKAKRLECRFPDAAGNPYFAYTVLLMAGLDGIKNKIDPGDPMDQNLYELEESALLKVPTVARSLHQAVEALDQDREFLKQGNVFDDDQIDAYIELKMEEVTRFESTPHPIEFDLYYSA